MLGLASIVQLVSTQSFPWFVKCFVRVASPKVGKHLPFLSYHTLFLVSRVLIAPHGWDGPIRISVSRFVRVLSRNRYSALSPNSPSIMYRIHHHLVHNRRVIWNCVFVYFWYIFLYFFEQLVITEDVHLVLHTMVGCQASRPSLNLHWNILEPLKTSENH